MNRFEWMIPGSLDAAARAATHTVARAMVSRSGTPPADAVVLKAGGIDLLDLMKEGLLTPRRIVNLRDLPGLDRIAPTQDGGLRIGAAVTLAQLAADGRVRTRYAALAQAAAGSASGQIRHVATVAGNLLQRPRCWYLRSQAHHCARKGGTTCFAFAGDNRYHAIFAHNGCAIVHPSTCATALVAFAAVLEIAGPSGARRDVRLEDFLRLPETDIHQENDLEPGEIVTAVRLPPLPQTVRSVHLRHGELDSFDWPLADVAVVLEFAGELCRSASIVLGAAAPTPHRAWAAESALTGRSIDASLAHAAAQAALQGAVPLTHNAYKLPIFAALIRRALLAV